MSHPTVQLARQQQNILDAVEALREAGLPTPRSDEVEMEPMVGDEQRFAAAIGDGCENLARLSRALDHTATHVIPGMDVENERRDVRLDKLEDAAKPKAAGSKKK